MLTSVGTCIAVVCNTGMRTEIGNIQKAITDAAKEEEDTPLRRKLDEFGDFLAKVCVVSILFWGLRKAR